MNLATMQKLAETLTVHIVQNEGMARVRMEELVSGARNIYNDFLEEFVRQEQRAVSASMVETNGPARS